MKLRYAVAALAALLLVPAARAQAPSGGTAGQTPAEVSAGRVGILNFRGAIANTAEGKQASAELQSKYAPRQTELESLRKQIDDAQGRGRQATISDEERARLARQIDQWTRLGQRLQENLQEDVNTDQDEVFQRIGGKMLDVIDRYARENGYTLIVDVSTQNSPVLYATPAINITQDIVRLYDQANPVKGGAAPAPAQQRPAQPGQARPPQPQPQKPPQQ